MAATPTLDKARTEELTTSEIKVALRELAAANGTAAAGLEIDWKWNAGLEARVIWRGGRRGAWKDSIEDAMLAEYDLILEMIAITEKEG